MKQKQRDPRAEQVPPLRDEEVEGLVRVYCRMLRRSRRRQMLPQGEVALAAGTLTFSFGIPEGVPGEVTQAQLSNDLVNSQNAAMLATLPLTSANSNGVALLNLTVSDPPTQAEMQAVASKLDELINTLRR